MIHKNGQLSVEINTEQRTIMFENHATYNFGRGITKLEIKICDLIADQENEFETLHQILTTYATTYKFSVEKLYRFIGQSPLIRLKYLEARLKIPRFVAELIYNALLDHDACEMHYGALKKLYRYASYLTQYVPESTESTPETAARKRYKYTIPTDEDLSMMSVEMIDEEIRVCEKARYKYQKEDLETLRNARSERIRETRLEKQAVARKKNMNSELQQFIDAAEEIVGNKKPRKEKE